MAGEWWPPYARFAALRWLAAARGALVPAPPGGGGLLLDVACGAGLLAPHLPAGWRHVGIDLSVPALTQAREHAVIPVRADAMRLPFPDGAFGCVIAGECLEHLPDLPAACAEIARVLAPGGTLVLDTIARSLFSRVVLIALAERVPGGPPPRCHDPALLVDRRVLRRSLEAAGVELEPMVGLRPSIPGYLRWLARRGADVSMIRVGSTSGVVQARGRKLAAPTAAADPAALPGRPDVREAGA
ncbi:MAG TPA: methyltransferase domain-containing protein [Mycobacteriales bacterium]|nr:methyltransferase domain-containing protein [Mycobacteriales bacterium]